MNSEDVVRDAPDEDLEDGEIEDDDDEEAPPAVAPEPAPGSPVGGVASPQPPRDFGRHREQRSEEAERPPGADKHKKKHLTEAEKSVMKIHKLERMEREKREKFRREQMHIPEPVDDYAVSLEKALAKVLKKDQKLSETEEKVEDDAKRGKKRKKKDKHKKAKRNKQDSPKNPEDEIERRSPEPMMMEAARSEGESSDSESSTDKNEMRKQQIKRELRRENAKSRRERRERSRERQPENNRQGFKKMRKRNVGICLYYLQGKCNDEHCQYSHDCVQPLKLELCKFYLLDCCAKGDKCLYMHSDFPCKYYHTGIPCPYGDDCKFAHGGPLADSVKQILFKHIETAPKEILGNFPRLSRENAHMMITQAQKNLEMRKQKEKDDGGGARAAKDEPEGDNSPAPGQGQGQQLHGQEHQVEKKRNRRSRWQDPEPEQLPGIVQGFGAFKDQDLRVNSNGDVDMRSMHQLAPTSIHPTDIANPNIFTTKPPPILPQNLAGLLQMQQAAGFNFLAPNIADVLKSAASVDIEQYKMDAVAKDAPAAEPAGLALGLGLGKDVDLRVPPPAIPASVPPAILSPTDADARLLTPASLDVADEEDNALQIVMDEEEVRKDEKLIEPEVKPTDQASDAKCNDELFNLPKVQRDLFARIQHQQKLNTPGAEADGKEEEQQQQQDQNIDWYSDDEDDNKLTIEHEDDEIAEPDEEKTDSPAEPPSLGDLSGIDLAEVSKIMSTIKESCSKDPRVGSKADPRRDPRIRNSVEEEKPVTIYEQSADDCNRLGRGDVDLRMGLSFKALGNYTPASEIDASVSSHPIMAWKVYVVEIPKPDYGGLKLSASDAQTSGDPRLRKIFRLSTEEKDSPASPGASPKPANANPAPRVDPRRKKALEAGGDAAKPADGPSTYAQQLSTLQSSPFYQSLTSNQKLMLNQELASRNDQSGMCDPIVAAMLANLGLQATGQVGPTAQHSGQALTILNSLAGFAAQPMAGVGGVGVAVAMPHGVNLNVAPPNLNLGQGLLGPAPGHIGDFNQLTPMGFDPRNQAMDRMDPRSQGLDPRNQGMDPRSAPMDRLDPRNQNSGPGILGNPPFDYQMQGGNLSDEDPEFGPVYDNGQDLMYNPYNHQRNQPNQNRDRNRRGRNNNNNNRNRNQFFRHNNRNNRNRNSPS